eukprot:CAMPEP_0194265838 /NCGR_PEP_ID=MMETSP0169-20130528/944_1 /TAXON_ID=218684 /ORGANISM="Corethron pennatum, Strain L29A3" /LENGTH=150 /DNA_ID=CAMNT_0039006391 /DNA_START=247 /DNA_END=696 /DNA_ORIENTATION=-
MTTSSDDAASNAFLPMVTTLSGIVIFIIFVSANATSPIDWSWLPASNSITSSDESANAAARIISIPVGITIDLILRQPSKASNPISVQLGGTTTAPAWSGVIAHPPWTRAALASKSATATTGKYMFLIWMSYLMEPILESREKFIFINFM